MRTTVKKKLLVAAAASTGLLGLVGYPTVKTRYPIRRQTDIDDYVDLPIATADLTKDLILPEGIGTGTDVPIDISHWLLLSLLKSSNTLRRERTLIELARQRRWNDAECVEIAQALDRQDIVRLARTVDADLRLFLKPPSVDFIQAILDSDKIEKLVKSMLKDVAEKTESCSSCTNFYTNLSIRVRPDSNVLAMSDLAQADKVMRIESRKRRKMAYNEDVIRLKAVLNNIICGEEQAKIMAESGILVALLYFRHKYPNDLQVNSLLAQILANLSLHKSTREFVFADGWIQTLVQYSRDTELEISLPAFKALANMDEETDAVFGNHIYLLAPVHRDLEPGLQYDVIFVHGLVGSVFKSWRQGTIAIDEQGNRCSPKNFTPTTELLPNLNTDESQNAENNSPISLIDSPYTRCWPKDWLAQDIHGLRVLAVDYPTSLSNWRTDCDLNKDSLRQRASHVMKQLEQAKLGDRPIIWVAHSMGGLLVKQMLVLCDELLQKSSNGRQPNGKVKNISMDGVSSNLNDDRLKQQNDQTISTGGFSQKFLENMTQQTQGIVFYSVPHKGSNLDWIERKNLQKLLQLTTEVIELQKGSPVLVDLHEKFLKFIRRPENSRIKFMTFAENAISSFGVNKVVQWRGVLVHEDSLQFEVGPTYQLNIDHAHTCKPHSKEALTYKRTMEFIRELMPSISKQPGRDEELIPFISFVI